MRGRGIEFIGIVRRPGDPVPRSVRPSLRMRWYHSAVQSNPRILAMFCLETWCRVIYRVRITVMIDVTTHIVAPMSQIAYIDAQLSDLNRYDSEYQALRKIMWLHLPQSQSQDPRGIRTSDITMLTR